jgi:high-affinity iron transporter
MFAATLIVFRESLEAALFVGIVAAATRQLPGRAAWLRAGVGLGAAGALALALLAERIGGWFDGLGQDVVNIAVLSLALVMLLWHCIWVNAKGKDMARDAHRLGASAQAAGRPWPLLVAVALAVLREGAETVLFVAGSVTNAAGVSSSGLVASCTLGLALGVLVGWALYAGLSRIPARHLFATVNLMVALLAGAIASQLARALTQAGLIEWWSSPVWDSSTWLDTHSALGSLLHALAGYDAQPSGVQLAFYLSALALIYAGPRLLMPRPAPAV